MKLLGLGTVATVFVFLLTPIAAHAAPMQQVSIGSTYCSDPAAGFGAPTCPTGVSTTGFLDSTTQHAHPTWQPTISVKGGGSTSATKLRFFVEANAGFSYASAVIADTYTITGAPGNIPITVSLTASATAEAVQRPPGDYFGSANFGLNIGTAVAASGRNVVNLLGSDTAASGNLFAPGLVNINMAAMAMLNVTVGVPFDLAYDFSVTGSSGIRADGLNTGTINISVPAGYTITSALGYGVPEPATFALALAATLFVFGRRKRARLITR